MRLALPTLLMAFCLIAAAQGQIPPGAFVVSSFGDPASPTLPIGGLTIADSRVPGQGTAILGLGPDLTGEGASQAQGANAIAIACDGALWVGEMGFGGIAIDLHRLTLSGNQITSDELSACGVVDAASQFGGGIQTITRLANGEFLLCVEDLVAPGPLAGEVLGHVDAEGVITPILVDPRPQGYMNCATATLDGRAAILASIETQPTLATSLYRVPLDGGAPRRLVRFVGATIGSITTANDGSLRCNVGGTLYSVDPDSGDATVMLVVGREPNGLATELAGSMLVMVRSGLQGTPRSLELVEQDRTSLLLADIPGIPSGVAVFDNPMPYGVDSPGAQGFRWQVGPNPGGFPRLGNHGFAVAVLPSGGDATGMAVFSLGRTEQAFRGTTLLVQLGPKVILPVPSDGRLNLFIPSDPVLVGFEAFLQSFHADSSLPGGLAASNGLWLTVTR